MVIGISPDECFGLFGVTVVTDSSSSLLVPKKGSERFRRRMYRCCPLMPCPLVGRGGALVIVMIVVLSMFSTTCVFGLHEDEAGLFDAKIETTGHGPVRYVGTILLENYTKSGFERSNVNLGISGSSGGGSSGSSGSSSSSQTRSLASLIITSDSGPTAMVDSSSSCYVACRSSESKNIVWRRNVCTQGVTSSVQTNRRHLTLVVPSSLVVITADVESSVVRCWNALDGKLLWENSVFTASESNQRGKKPTSPQRIRQLWISRSDPSFVGVDVGEGSSTTTVAFHIATGDSGSKLQIQGMGKSPPLPSIAQLKSEKTLATCPFPLDGAKPHLTITIAEDGKSLRVIDSKSPDSTSSSLDIFDTRSSLSYPDSVATTTPRMLPSDFISNIHVVHCIDRNFNANKDSHSIEVLVATQKGLTAFLVIYVSSGDVKSAPVFEIHWSAEESLGQVFYAIMLSDPGTHVITTQPSATTTTTNTANGDPISSGLLQENPWELLSFGNRLRLQYQSIKAVFSSPLSSMMQFFSGADSSAVGFGLIKIAVLLTPYKVLAIDTTRHTNIRYQIDLPFTSDDRSNFVFRNEGDNGENHMASWRHQIVHGSTNSLLGSHGINGGAHTRDVLIVSRRRPTLNSNTDNKSEVIQYVCFDGATGNIHVRGTVQLPVGSTETIQIVPMASPQLVAGSDDTTLSNSSRCRQDALLVLDDFSILSVLDGSKVSTTELLRRHSFGRGTLESTSGKRLHQGLYTHVVDRSTSQVTSLSLLLPFSVSTPTTANTEVIATANVIGSTVFVGEKIVKVAYPNREEVVQSPCNVLGDESILLKYLNPHLMVLVTVRQDDDEAVEHRHRQATKNNFDLSLVTAALSKSTSIKTKKKKKRKPLGVTTPSGRQASEIAIEDDYSDEQHQEGTLDNANLFVNVVDSVSGRILYRIGHSNAVVSSAINLLISENWIFYTFVNARTRRTELGVLSLYEGMIDPTGLTAFTSFDTISTTAFSSFDARETKPVVLSKLFTVTKPITALGITATRAGISTRRLLLASEGQIHSIDRKLLEPRRPAGPLKESEKKEGLVQYNELIAIVPSFQTTISYNVTMDAIATILSVPTDLESQTVIFAYGGLHQSGPDLYMARISPNRGFDLLPDSFNKPMLTLTVLALAVIVIVVQRMASKKILSLSW